MLFLPFFFFGYSIKLPQRHNQRNEEEYWEIGCFEELIVIVIKEARLVLGIGDEVDLAEDHHHLGRKANAFNVGQVGRDDLLREVDMREYQDKKKFDIAIPYQLHDRHR